jgi:hypothetical protein
MIDYRSTPTANARSLVCLVFEIWPKYHLQIISIIYRR